MQKSGKPVTRVFILDDHPVLRYGLVQMIGMRPDLRICGEAGSLSEARDLIKKQRPDVLIADIWLPDGSGLDFIQEVRRMIPKTKVLIYSIHQEEVFAYRAVRAGARGFVMKRAQFEQLMTAVDAVVKGDIFLSPDIIPKVMRQMLDDSNSTDPGVDPLTRLSAREMEVFKLLGHGATSKHVARMLNLSLKTVETYRYNIKAKLGLKTSHQLTYMAFCYFHSL